MTQLTQGWPLLGRPSSCWSVPLPVLHRSLTLARAAEPSPQMPFPRVLGRVLSPLAAVAGAGFL